LYPNLKDFASTFPRVNFEFKGPKMIWEPMDYLVRPIEVNDHICIGVKSLKNVILGAILLRNYDVFFDRTD